MNDYECHLCGQVFDVFTRYYATKPFLDGRKYAILCDNCIAVPKMWTYDEKKGEVVVYPEPDPRRLNSVADMMEDGFSKRPAEISIKAVKAAIKKSLK